MNHPNYLIIHKKEWDRIKRVDRKTNQFKDREEYFKSLSQQSQEIIEKWSDSVQGHINKLEKQKQMKYAKALETVKDFQSRKKLKYDNDVIKKAKDLIFQDSCYGRQLLSALLESKALEEREAQIKFQLEYKTKFEVQKNLQPEDTSLPIGNNTELKENQSKFNRKQIEMETAQINKQLCEMKHKENNEKREKEKQNELENEDLIKLILENEVKLEREMLNREKEELKLYEKQNDKIKKAREHATQKEDLIREVWSKYNDKIKRGEKTVFDKIHKDSCNNNRSQNAYKIVEQLNYEKDKKYNDFIETGIKRNDQRLNKQDKQGIESQTIERNKRKLLDKDNKLMIELKRQIDLNIDSNCYKQDFNVQGINKEKRSSAEKRRYSLFLAAKPTFMAPYKKILNLKKRENEKSSWNGVAGAHAQFAKHASDTLRDCRYKSMAWKAINDYRRNNCIDGKDLPV